jgi:hypothetical protein
VAQTVLGNKTPPADAGEEAGIATNEAESVYLLQLDGLRIVDDGLETYNLLGFAFVSAITLTFTESFFDVVATILSPRICSFLQPSCQVGTVF